MTTKVESEQLYRCKTLNCSKSFKNASSLFRHNKCCVDFIKGADHTIGSGGLNGSQFINGVNVAVATTSVAAVGDVNDEEEESSSDGEVQMKAIETTNLGNRSADCLCEESAQVHVYESMEAPTEKNVNGEKIRQFEDVDANGKKMKKQVILNPSGKNIIADSFTHDDLVIDEVQAAKLESYSCYAGVPQRDKAGERQEK